MIKISNRFALIAALLFIALFSACGGSNSGSNTQEINRPTTPAEYAGKENPLTADPRAADLGKQLYTVNCASCHGPEAMGDGASAASLNPKPKPLATEMKMLTDDYLFWRISEGGAFSPFTSAMPAWKKILSEEEIWQIIAFLRKFQQ